MSEITYYFQNPLPNDEGYKEITRIPLLRRIFLFKEKPKIDLEEI